MIPSQEEILDRSYCFLASLSLGWLVVVAGGWGAGVLFSWVVCSARLRLTSSFVQVLASSRHLVFWEGL
jgi:hypothetical protein